MMLRNTGANDAFRVMKILKSNNAFIWSPHNYLTQQNSSKDGGSRKREGTLC